MRKKFPKTLLLILFLSTALLCNQVHASSKVVKIGTATCVDKNGRAKCTPDYSAIAGQTGKVIVNGWINYGPWAPRPPRYGVIIP